MQRKATGSGAEVSDPQAVASQGFTGGATALPHADRIQSLFGRHDVSSVQAHVGGPAAAASSQLGAEAYAMGDRVAFSSQPSLHTAAHEAAHVVQQRAGVQLTGPMSDHDHPDERHADAVADAVVAGRSAEGLLDQRAGGGGGGSSVIQRQPAVNPAAGGGAAAALPPDIASLDLAGCQAMARAMYLGTDAYDHNGILDHKIDAVTTMATRFASPEPPNLTVQVIVAAIAVGAGAAAGALGAVFLGPLAGALIWGASALVAVLPTFFTGGPSAPINPTLFVEKYLASLRQGWPASVNQLITRMGTDVDQARRVTADVRRLQQDPDRIRTNQQGELLDEFTNATLQAHTTESGRGDASARGGVGDISYDDATEGRLHFGGATIGIDTSTTPNSPKFYKPHTATMEGVPGPDARNLNLTRRIRDIHVVKTMDVLAATNAFAVAVPATGAPTRVESGDLGYAKTQLASLYLHRWLDADDSIFEGSHDQPLIDANWSNGLNLMWDQIQDTTITALGIGSIGT